MRDFLRWWLTRLGELLPPALRRLGGSVDDAMVITPVGLLAEDAGGVAVSLRRGGVETPLGRFGLHSAGLAELSREGDRAVVIRLGGGDVLSKTVVLPLAAERDLAQVLGFEMDRETPFTVDELYWNHRIETRDRDKGLLSVRVFLLPRARLAGLLAALHHAGLFPRRAEVTVDGEAGCALALDTEAAGAGRAQRWLVRAAAAACALLAITAVALPFIRQQLALAAVDAEIAAQRAAVDEAATLNRELTLLTGSLDAVAKQRAETGIPLAILAAATRILPDDTYLTELTLRQRRITLTGRSPAAARLIGTLAADGEFREPAFAAPVTRLEALHTEVFTITAEVLP